MKAAILAIGILSFAASEASAISRYQTMRMGCDDVRGVLRHEGAAILRWQSKRTPGLPLYGRYVSDGRFCNSGEVTEFASVPTADDRACPVRKCVQRDPLRDRRRLLFPFAD